MNALQQLRERLAVGAEIEVVENTGRPAAAGALYTITKVHRATVAVDSPEIRGWIAVPTRVRDVEWLDANTVRWPNPRCPGNTLTYRIRNPR